jgi:hypothetical protein
MVGAAGPSSASSRPAVASPDLLVEFDVTAVTA